MSIKVTSVSALTAVGILGLILGGLYCLAIWRDEFVVTEGFLCEGCMVSERTCAGVSLRTDMRDGIEVRCVGIPLGARRCFEVVPDENWKPIPCPAR